MKEVKKRDGSVLWGIIIEANEGMGYRDAHVEARARIPMKKGSGIRW